MPAFIAPNGQTTRRRARRAPGRRSGRPIRARGRSVPTRGIERWLTQRLSARLGTTPGRARRRLREHRVPVPRATRRRRAGARQRDRARAGSLAPRADGLAAARGRRGLRLRSRGWRCSRATCRRPGAALRTAAPTRPPVRRVLGAATRAARRLGPRRGSRRDGPPPIGRPSSGGGCESGSACRAGPSVSIRRCAVRERPESSSRCRIGSPSSG